jgi:phage terminase large subunit-like protein
MAQSPPTTPEQLKAALTLVQNPILTFIPTGAQDQFLRLGEFIQIFSGANWPGKTTVGAVKLSTILFRPANQFLRSAYPMLYQYKDSEREPKSQETEKNRSWSKSMLEESVRSKSMLEESVKSKTLSKQEQIQDSYKLYRPAPVLRFRIVSTHTAVENDLIPALKRWFPRGQYRTAKGLRPFESQWKLQTGSVGDIMTYDQDPEEFEAVKLDVAWFDEPPPYRIFVATLARMKPGAMIFLTMTPLSGAGWLFDRVNNPWGAKSWGLVYADIESACVQHGVRGYLQHEDIQEKVNEYDPDEREARVHGKPMYLSGRIYKSWDRSQHVVEPFDLPGDWTRYFAVDPHDRKPFAACWLAVAPDGKMYVYDEHPHEPYHLMKSCTWRVKDYAGWYQQQEGGQTIALRIIDARYGKRSSVQTGQSIRDQLDACGIVCCDSYLDEGGAIDAGHQAVKELLAPGADGTPTLRVFSTCRNVIYAFEHYVWGEARDPERGLKEKPLDTNKDFMDALRYLAMEQPRYVPPVVTAPPPPHWATAQERGFYGTDGS